MKRYCTATLNKVLMKKINDTKIIFNLHYIFVSNRNFGTLHLKKV